MLSLEPAGNTPLQMFSLSLHRQMYSVFSELTSIVLLALMLKSWCLDSGQLGINSAMLAV